MDRTPSSATEPSPANTRRTLRVFVPLLILFTAAFVALGVWQVRRLSWKLDLIARVEARVHAAPQPAPGPDAWSSINDTDDAYRHVTISGRLMNDLETQVYAVTDLGPGYWVVTPLRAPDGTVTLINRGFVPTDKRDPRTRQAGETADAVEITGLLRIDEPKGTLLRSNVPSEERWYSRDVAAIAAARGLKNVAPYFIDADASPNPGGLPVGGLTQVRFPNSHLSYAITWFAMALMSVGMLAYLVLGRRWPWLQGAGRR
jgi:surfeit locus 1 family protein